MTEKFTPGEWTHCILGGESGYPFVFENKTGEGIANVFIQQGNVEKGIANAALIAASPKMYKKLEEIYNAFFTLSFRALQSENEKKCKLVYEKSNGN